MHYYIFFIFIFDETTLWWCSLSSCVVALNIFISLHSIPIKHIITNFQNDKVQLNNIRAKQGACLQLWKNSTSPRLSFFFLTLSCFLDIVRIWVLTGWCFWSDRRVKWSTIQDPCLRSIKSTLLRTVSSWLWTCAVGTMASSLGSSRWRTSEEIQERK